MKTVFIVAAIAATMALAGCGSNGPYGGHDEKWYEQHNKARIAEAHWCNKLPMNSQLKNSSCEGAEQATTVYYENPKHLKAFLNRGTMKLPRDLSN